MSFEFEYRVLDTQIPKLIGVENMTLRKGEQLDLTTILAEDPVTGTVPVAFKGTYNDLDHVFNTQEVGEYTLEAEATDDNGNVTASRFVVTVTE